MIIAIIITAGVLIGLALFFALAICKAASLYDEDEREEEIRAYYKKEFEDERD